MCVWPIVRVVRLSVVAALFVGCSTESPRRHPQQPGDSAAAAEQVRRPPEAQLIDINRASADELSGLPGIGPSLAARIVEHRERHGKFRRAEHLIAVRGFSERRFREIKHMIAAEP